MKTMTVSHNDLIDTYSDGVNYLTESGADIISYNTQKKLMMFNVDMLEIDKDRNRIYTFPLKKEADIIDNIHIVSPDNVKVKYIIGGYEYDHINTFLSVSARYHEFHFKLIFTTEPKFRDEITICYRNYLLNSELKESIIRTPVIKTDTNKYNNGMCLRL